MGRRVQTYPLSLSSNDASAPRMVCSPPLHNITNFKIVSFWIFWTFRPLDIRPSDFQIFIAPKCRADHLGPFRDRMNFNILRRQSGGNEPAASTASSAAIRSKTEWNEVLLICPKFVVAEWRDVDSRDLTGLLIPLVFASDRS